MLKKIIKQDGFITLETSLVFTVTVLIITVFVGFTKAPFQELISDMKEQARVISTRQSSEKIVECEHHFPLGRDPYVSHDQAKQAMILRMKGKTTVKTVSNSSNRRVIDVWDGVAAHQIYYGLRKWDPEIKEQYRKDVLLIQNEQVHFIVWHFFEHARLKHVGPTAELANMLREAGIGYVIHLSENKPSCAAVSK